MNERDHAMRIWQIFSAILMIALLSVSSAWGQNLNGEWEKANESDGIIAFTRSPSEDNVHEIMAIGTVDVSVAVVEALLRDVAAQPEYVYLCTEAFVVDIPGLENTKDITYLYSRTGMPWPAYDRDVVVKAECMINEETGALLFQARSISADFKAQDERVVRIPKAIIEFVATPRGENKIELLYHIQMDPGGDLPAFIVNELSEDLAVKTIEGIREMVKKDKYKNAKSIVTTTPWIMQKSLASPKDLMRLEQAES
jgi:hypothetical protein